MNPLINPRLASLQLLTLYAWLAGFGTYMVLSALVHFVATGHLVVWKLLLGLFLAVGGLYRNYKQAEATLEKWEVLSDGG